MVLTRRLLLTLLACAAVPCWAQESRTYAHNYDLNATAYTYCVTVKGPGPDGQRIKTVGSSTTVTAVSGTPFAELEVGDDLHVLVDSTEARRRITAKASSTSVTVDTAVDWENGGNGRSFSFSDITCGTATTDGWVPTMGLVDKMVTAVVTTEASSGGLDISIECRGTGENSAPVQVLAANLTGTTAPTNGEEIPVPESCSAIRVGLKWGTADGGVDSVSAYIVGFARAR